MGTSSLEKWLVGSFACVLLRLVVVQPLVFFVYSRSKHHIEDLLTLSPTLWAISLWFALKHKSSLILMIPN